MRYLDPVAAIIGGASVCVSLAMGVPAPAAIGIGAVVLAIADARRLQLVARPPIPPPPARVEGPLHPDEEGWIRRAGDAVTAIRHSVGIVDPGPLKDRLGDVAAEAQRVLDDLRRLAGQVSVTRLASNQVDVSQLATDLDRLTSTLRQSSDPEMGRDLQRSVDAVREQLRIGRRLAAARKALQARVESGALGLQQMAAQVGEMTALAPPGGGVWQHGERIEELTAQLEALRAGLSDAGAMSHRALGAIDTEGGDDVPVAP
jgi:hypothetical protein